MIISRVYTPGQIYALGQLYIHGELPPKWEGLNPQSLVALVAMGLVRRTPAGDYVLAEAGLKVFEAQIPPADRFALVGAIHAAIGLLRDGLTDEALALLQHAVNEHKAAIAAPRPVDHPKTRKAPE